MSNEISKAMKQKTDAQFRMLEQETAPIIRENATGETYEVNPSEYSQSLAAGKNITITTAGNIKTINAVMNILAGDNITISAPDENGAVTITGTVADTSIDGKPVNIADYTGKDGFILSYDETADEFILTEAAGSGAELQQATETTLGGIKAKEKTTETAEVAIDTATGKLYTAAPDEAANGIPAGGTAGQVLAKIDEVNYNSEWIDPPSGGGGGIYDFMEITNPQDSIILSVPTTDKFEIVLFYPSAPSLKCNPSLRFNNDSNNNYDSYRWNTISSSKNDGTIYFLTFYASSNVTAGKSITIKYKVIQKNGRAFMDGSVFHDGSTGILGGTWQKGSGETINSVLLESPFGDALFPVGVMAMVII